MKKLFFIAIGLSALLSSCNNLNPTSDQILKIQQEQLMQEANAQTGMPAIKNFQERKMMKMILELRDQENLICYAYIASEMTGKPVFLGKCIGYGLPYSTQYTSPEKEIKHSADGGGNTVVPQADPNGLFMPTSADGTWLLMIDPTTNEPKPVYIEPKVLVSPFKL